MKSIIITGANSGIGFECALHLATMAPEEQIILACRNITAGQQALEKIRQETGHPNLLCLSLDLASVSSIQNFTKAFSKLPGANVVALVNNAGIQHIGKTAFTQDGFEITFGTNHLGPFYLTLLLLPYMNPGGSITFTASDTHDPLQKTGIAPPVYTTARDLAFPKETNESPNLVGQRRYSTSKLCNVLTTYRLQAELAGTSIRVNAFDPGLTPGTGLAKNYPAVLRFAWRNIMPLLGYFRTNTNSPSTSGQRLARLAYAKELSPLKGVYFSDGKVKESSADSYSTAFGQELWQSSMELLGMTQPDLAIPLYN